MISEIYLVITSILAVIVWTIIALKRKISYDKILIVVIFIFYMTALIGATLFPIVYDHSFMKSKDVIEHRLKLIPFEVIIETLNRNSPFNAVVQILGNIIMTLPFGFLLPMIIRFKKKYTYIITAFLMPVCIEATQLVLGLSLGTLYRTADIDDVILNSTGIFIGYAVYKLFFYLKEKRMQKQNDK